VGFAVVQGRYGQDNYTSGEALPLYNTGDLYPCGTLVFLGSPNTYAFQPMNDSFSFYSGSTVAYSGEASVSISTSGYWTGGQDDVAAAFRPFPPGAYTIIGADEWGGRGTPPSFPRVTKERGGGTCLENLSDGPTPLQSLSCFRPSSFPAIETVSLVKDRFERLMPDVILGA
jgi:hypothetical protein